MTILAVLLSIATAYLIIHAMITANQVRTLLDRLAAAKAAQATAEAAATTAQQAATDAQTALTALQAQVAELSDPALVQAVTEATA